MNLTRHKHNRTQQRKINREDKKKKKRRKRGRKGRAVEKKEER